jgi:flagellar biosynthesis/type III secretory pathway ATPase
VLRFSHLDALVLEAQLALKVGDALLGRVVGFGKPICDFGSLERAQLHSSDEPAANAARR